MLPQQAVHHLYEKRIRIIVVRFHWVRKLAVLQPLLAGALLPFAFAPFNFYFLAVFSPCILLISLQKTFPLKAFWKGWMFGLGAFGVGVSWVQVSIHQYGHASWLLSIFLTLLFVCGLALFIAVQSWSWVRFFCARRGGYLVAYPLLWILFEWLRGWVLTGFPWLYLGYSQVDSPLSGYLPVVGVLGVSGLVVLSSSLIFIFLKRLCQISLSRFRERNISVSLSRLRERVGVRVVIMLFLLWLGGSALQHVEWVSEQGEALSVALVQGNVPQEEKWRPGQKIPILKKYLALTEPHWGKTLIIWPENAVPFFSDQIQSFIDALSQKAEQHGSTVILGIPIEEVGGERYFNGVIALGEGKGTYLKHRLVPFGEYVPFEKWLRGVIAFFDLPMSDFASGPFSVEPFSVGPLKLGISICYEIAYGRDFARQAKRSHLLVTLSDDGWFGRSIGPDQHLQIARARALETGRSILRATNTGITAVIDHHGKVRARLPQDVAHVLTSQVNSTEGWTPYIRFL
ncbi:MAG: apolipoprotein N-acyltransferase [Gammaproteobacteria bacterium]|nr:apolipoprotein N-acyltransferase [Gammaproteobacteria bacterium]